MDRVVVVGADAAGMSAAHQALRTARARGRELRVVVVDSGVHTSYSACGIPYWIAGDLDGADRLVARTAAQHVASGIDLRLRTTAVGLDLAAGTLEVRGADGRTERLGYDELVLATGAHPRVPDWALAPDGSCARGVRPVKTLDDGAAWIDELRTREPRRAVVVGGGYIGIETAEAFVRRGLRTTLVTKREVMGTLDPDMGGRVREGMTSGGVEVVCSEEVDGLEFGADGAVAGVRSGDDVFPGDVVALGLGVTPATELAKDAGLPLGAFGGLLPDERQRVADGVWAAGDCCESVERLAGHRVYVPLGTHANKQGRVAGENLAGGDATFGGVLGTAITQFVAGGAHVEVGRTGPTTEQATIGGQRLVSLVTESTTTSGYMPQARPIAVKVLARPDGRLVGVQIVGGPGSAKRIDTAAAALWFRARVQDVAGMDLSYAPPFSPVWDPVQIACRRLADRLVAPVVDQT
ncbi:MAG TPA: FAD-dependent oxidoreductase [Kineosporiaceae bacterium]|nr:FAD-dependent oxidoreductase [Kineosporiaceae bacterium]